MEITIKPKKRRRRPNLRIRKKAAPGSSPGIIIADPLAPQPSLSLTIYDREIFAEHKLASPDELRHHLGREPLLWLDVDGLGNSEIIREIGQIFSLHPLALEDVVNVHQRPKVDEYEDCLFIVVRMPVKNGDCFATEQLSLFVKKGVLITFQEKPGGDCFELVRDRLRKSRGKIRERGVDYLAYALLDAVIDYYFPALEKISDELESLEDSAIASPDQHVVARVHELKQELLSVRRAVWPMRDALNTMIRDSSPFIGDDTRIYLRDCFDHAFQIVDLVETYREICADIRDIYLSSVSNRMNEIMKVLTIISTIFIPLTFVVGVYGMNFDTNASPYNMPELKAYYGYPICIALMAAIAGALLLFFRRRRWI